jgi:hypothetical protein
MDAHRRRLDFSDPTTSMVYDVQLSHGFALSYGYEGYFADSAGTGCSSGLAQGLAQMGK